MGKIKTVLAHVVFPVLCGVMVFWLGAIVGHQLAKWGVGNVKLNSIVSSILLLTCICAALEFRQKKSLRKIQEERRRSVKALIDLQRAFFKTEELPNLLEVNAAIARVIESRGVDAEAMKAVLKYCSKINPSLDWHEQVKRGPSGKSFHGLTREFGMVEVQDEPKKTEQFSGLEKARVGQYKIWRDLSVLFIQHYWQADLSTVTNLLDAYAGYAIIFHPYTFEPVGFGELVCGEVGKGLLPSSKYVLLMVKVVSGISEGLFFPIGVIYIR